MDSILIIDDEPQIRKLLSRIMELEGYEVWQAADCQSTLKQLKLHRPQVALCDVFLPDGNGVELVSTIKRLYPEIEVILLTAHGNIPDGVQAIKIGDTKPTKVDLRIISATNRDLKKEVVEGHFREDLYYRLSVFQIHLLPLRERREDIELLARSFVRLFSQKLNKEIGCITPGYLNVLQTNEWKGNIRELRNVIERSMIVCDGQLTVEDLPFELQNTHVADAGSLNHPEFELAAVEKRHIARVLQYTRGTLKCMCRILAKASIRAIIKVFSTIISGFRGPRDKVAG